MSMTATEIIREALEIYARSTLGPDRGLAEQLANQAYDMAAAVGRADPAPVKQKRLTPAQVKAFADYQFAAYQACKALGMGSEHGL